MGPKTEGWVRTLPAGELAARGPEGQSPVCPKGPVWQAVRGSAGYGREGGGGEVTGPLHGACGPLLEGGTHSWARDSRGAGRFHLRVPTTWAVTCPGTGLLNAPQRVTARFVVPAPGVLTHPGAPWPPHTPAPRLQSGSHSIAPTEDGSSATLRGGTACLQRPSHRSVVRRGLQTQVSVTNEPSSQCSLLSLRACTHLHPTALHPGSLAPTPPGFPCRLRTPARPTDKQDLVLSSSDTAQVSTHVSPEPDPVSQGGQS